MALGIAASRTGGLTANTGTMVKSTHPGNAARMGAEAGILAEMGYTSNDEVLEGYAAALFQGNLDWDILTQNLGSPYRLVDPGFDIKRFPAQVYMQNPIEAVLNLRQKHNLTADMVESLTVHRQGRGHSGPVPQSGLDGKFSVEYCAAVALLDGRVVIDSFTDRRRFSPDLELMLGKVHVDPVELEPGLVRVTARLTDGRTVSDECRGFKGSAGNPMSRDERMDKVWDCIGRALPREDAQQVIDLVEDLENLADISVLMQIMGQQSPVRA
jgi:2-methylcitrate dehydratase PrpD